jgi:hypothetical protein
MVVSLRTRNTYFFWMGISMDEGGNSIMPCTSGGQDFVFFRVKKRRALKRQMHAWMAYGPRYEVLRAQGQ